MKEILKLIPYSFVAVILCIPVLISTSYKVVGYYGEYNKKRFIKWMEIY